MATSFQPVAGATFDGVLFEPTTGDQVEAGIKWDDRSMGPDVRFFASLAAYEIVQENVLTPDPDPTHPFASVQEGEVEVKGVELEVAARIRERMTFNLAFTSIDSEVTKTTGTDLGNELVAVPDMLVSALADYTFQEGTLAGLGFGLGLRYRGQMYGDGANQWQSDSVTVYDAILHYDTRDWRFAVNASNFTDEIFVDRCSSASNCFYGCVAWSQAASRASFDRPDREGGAVDAVDSRARVLRRRPRAAGCPAALRSLPRHEELTTLLEQWAERAGPRRAREHRHDT